MIISNLFLLFFVVLALSLVLSPLVMKISLKADLTDDVNHRSSHKVPTPRGGGLIFIFSSAIVLLFNYVFHLFNLPAHLFCVVLLSYACALLGFLDDKYSLPSWLRFLVQLLLVLYPVFQMPLIFPHQSGWIQYGLYAISWLWFINLFNFMDGTDGYASQEALFILLFIAVAVPGLRSLSLCLMAAVCGFLKVNYPKASIFMGDAGSYFLGYILFGMMLYSFSAAPNFLIPCVIVSLLFIADSTYTLIRRIIRKESFLSAHRTHWYQRLYNIGYSHRYIFWLGVIVNCCLISLALFSLYYGYLIGDLFLSLVVISSMALMIVTKERKYNKYKLGACK